MFSNPTVNLLHLSLPNLQADVLIDSNGSARLADFTFVTIALDQSTTTPTFREGGAIRWMGPELFDPGMFGLNDRRPTKESDLHGLGMVIYEVLSGQIPFATDRDSAVIRKVLEGERPGRPQGEEGKPFTDDIWGTLKLCWKHRPRDRINAGAVLLRLERQPPMLRPAFTLNVSGDAETGGDTELGATVSDSGTFPHSAPGSPLISHYDRTANCTRRQ